MALLSKYNPQWFPHSAAGKDGVAATGYGGGSEDSGGGVCGGGGGAAAPAPRSDEDKQRAVDAIAKQRAAAMALLNQHNSDWFGDAGVSDKRPSTTRRKSLRECLRLLSLSSVALSYHR